MKLWLILSLLAVTFWAHGQSEARWEELSRRIRDLERQQEDLMLQSSQNRNQVNSFLRNTLTLGGFFESGLLTLDGPDTTFQSMNSSNILGLNLAAEYTSRIRFVSQILTGLAYPLLNEHNNPNADPASLPREREFGDAIFGAVLSQGYVEYAFSDPLKIQAGAGYVPFGYALQQRERVLFIRRNGPQILRTTDLASPLWGGLHVLGNFNSSKGEWGYNLYTANPTDDSREIGAGGRVWWTAPRDQLTLGLSGQFNKYDGQRNEVVGADAHWRNARWRLTTEFAQHVTEEADPWSAYVEPSIFIYDERVLLYVFGDYAMSTLPTSGAGTDYFQKWEYGLGVNWLPTSFTRLRAGLALHDYVGNSAVVSGQNRDYMSLDLSAGVAF